MNSPEQKSGSPKRPVLVTALAVLVVLDALRASLNGITSAITTTSKYNGVVALLVLLFLWGIAAVEFVVAWGLWQLKNWARIALIILIALTSLLFLGEVASVADQPVFLLVVLVIGLSLRGAAIFWLVANGAYFQDHANIQAPTALVAFSSATPSSANIASKGMNKWLIGAVISILLACLCLGIGIIALATVTASGGLTSLLQKPRVATSPPVVITVPTAVPTPVIGSPFAHAVLSFGEDGTAPGMFQDPAHIAADNNGNVYVSENRSLRIQKFDSTGKYVGGWVIGAEGGDQTKELSEPDQLAADRAGNLYVVYFGSILKYDGNSGKFLAKITRDAFVRDFKRIAVLPDNSLYALDVPISQEDDLVHLDSNLKEIGRIPKIVSNVLGQQSIGTFGENLSLAVDIQGSAFILDYYPSFTPNVVSILKYDRDGKYVSRFGSVGTSPDQFDGYEKYIAVDTQSRVYVPGEKKISVFDANGQFVDYMGGPYDGADIAINDKNEIYTLFQAPSAGLFPLGGIPSSSANIKVYQLVLNNPSPQTFIPPTLAVVPFATPAQTPTSAASPTITPAPNATPGSLTQTPAAFSENFNDNSNRWATGVLDDRDDTATISVENGKYRWVVTAKQFNTLHTTLNTMSPYSDFVASIDCQQTSGTPSIYCGMVFHLDNNASNFYLFGLSDNRDFAFFLHRNNVFATLIDQTHSEAIHAGETNQLKVIASGSHFALFINNQPVGEVNDSALASGTVGPALYLKAGGDQGTFEFDNLQIVPQ